MKYFIIAGERSGDMYGAQLIHAIKELDSEAIFNGFGGQAMQQAGTEIIVPLEQLAFMGFKEVALKYFQIRKLFKIAKSAIESFNPDVIIHIDYAGFNLRMAKWEKQRGYKTVQYIAPKVWAWNSRRITKLEKYIDRLLLIFPFEEDYFKPYNINAQFIGNPLVEQIRNSQFAIRTSKEVIALLPGSRRQEVERILPLMMEVVQRFKEEQFVVAGVSEIDQLIYEEIISASDNISLAFDDSHAILKQSKAAIVTSGTATLEVALFKVPQVVVYKAGRTAYQIAKRLIKVKFISLVNLLMNREVVKELIQGEANADSISKELVLLLNDKAYRSKMLNDYLLLEAQFNKKEASKNAAKIILELVG